MGKVYPPKDRFAMAPGTEARAVLACEELRITRRQFMEDAATAHLARLREQVKVNRFQTARSAAERDRHSSMPDPESFGLSRDFHVPAHVQAAPPALKPFRPR